MEKQALLSSAAAIFGAGARLNVNNMRPYVDPKTGESRVLVFNSAGKPLSMKTNATALLQTDEWKDIDRTVIQSALQRMVGIADLRSRGLTHNLGSIGVTISLWDALSDMTEANVSMSAITKGEKDTPAYTPASVPVPIVHKEFQVELRRLEASRRFGESIDTTASGMASRLVSERSERMLFNGESLTVDGARIYGYTTHPDRSTVDLTTAWPSITSANNIDIIDDVMAMMTASRNDLRFGPWILYIPAGWESKLDEDYRANDNRTIRQRLLALSGLEDIKVADFLTANNAVLVQMVRDVVDLAIAQDITTVQWQVMGGMAEEFKVMAVWVPRIKSDYNGRSGIVHLRAP